MIINECDVTMLLPIHFFWGGEICVTIILCNMVEFANNFDINTIVLILLQFRRKHHFSFYILASQSIWSLHFRNNQFGP